MEPENFHGQKHTIYEYVIITVPQKMYKKLTLLINKELQLIKVHEHLPHTCSFQKLCQAEHSITRQNEVSDTKTTKIVKEKSSLFQFARLMENIFWLLCAQN